MLDSSSFSIDIINEPVKLIRRLEDTLKTFRLKLQYRVCHRLFGWIFFKSLKIVYFLYKYFILKYFTVNRHPVYLEVLDFWILWALISNTRWVIRWLNLYLIFRCSLNDPPGLGLVNRAYNIRKTNTYGRLGKGLR